MRESKEAERAGLDGAWSFHVENLLPIIPQTKGRPLGARNPGGLVEAPGSPAAWCPPRKAEP
jgi:hypothetical protein